MRLTMGGAVWSWQAQVSTPLDVMLPRMGGVELLKELGSRSCVPVLMLTARGDDIGRILGLEVGADDYLPKPFNPRELVARIRAILADWTTGVQGPTASRRETSRSTSPYEKPGRRHPAAPHNRRVRLA